jgi:hypothetical protein
MRTIGVALAIAVAAATAGCVGSSHADAASVRCTEPHATFGASRCATTTAR